MKVKRPFTIALLSLAVLFLPVLTQAQVLVHVDSTKATTVNGVSYQLASGHLTGPDGTTVYLNFACLDSSRHCLTMQTGLEYVMSTLPDNDPDRYPGSRVSVRLTRNNASAVYVVMK